MHQVQLELTDQIYAQAKLRADEAGFSTVDEYLTDILTDDLSEEFVAEDPEGETENLDHLFTPERLAHVDRVIADIKAGGKTYTSAEVREHFRKRFRA